jgi:hypothetical protein
VRESYATSKRNTYFSCEPRCANHIPDSLTMEKGRSLKDRIGRKTITPCFFCTRQILESLPLAKLHTRCLEVTFAPIQCIANFPEWLSRLAFLCRDMICIRGSLRVGWAEDMPRCHGLPVSGRWAGRGPVAVSTCVQANK